MSYNFILQYCHIIFQYKVGVLFSLRLFLQQLFIVQREIAFDLTVVQEVDLSGLEVAEELDHIKILGKAVAFHSELT